MPITASSARPARVIVAVATTPERRVIERTHLSDDRITVLQTGVGPTQVRSVAKFIATAKPAGLVSFGTAGGLVADLPPGRLLLPRQVSMENGQIYRVATAWHERVCRQLIDHEIETGCLLSVNRPAHSPQDKQQLHALTSAVAVDMESSELAQIAAHLSIPFLVIRAVADPHDQPLPHSAVAALTAHGELNIAGLLGQLLRRPAELGALLRLSAKFRIASQALNACCRVAGEQICSPDQ